MLFKNQKWLYINSKDKESKKQNKKVVRKTQINQKMNMFNKYKKRMKGTNI